MSAPSERSAPPATRWRFDVDDYHRMAEVGILSEDDPVELIEGEILVMSPMGSRHSACVARLNGAITGRLAGRAVVFVQNAIRLDESSEPEPDLAVLRPRPDFYAARLPGPQDVLFLVEVMDSSAEFDRKVKLALYARSGIAETWLVDLNGGRVEVYRGPGEGAYAHDRTCLRGQTVSPEAFPDLVLRVDDILG